MAKRIVTLALPAVVIATFVMFLNPAAVHADNGCTRQAVPTLTQPSNPVCPSPPVAAAATPPTCVQGFDGDDACAGPDDRGQAWASVASAPSGTVLNLLNQQRAQNGCGAVGSNGQLSAAAARHSNDMLVSGVTGHVGSDGSSPGARIAATGYAPVALSGEIAFWGTGGLATPENAVRAWMDSPGHRAIITNCLFVDIGVWTATANGKMTAVAVFARH